LEFRVPDFQHLTYEVVDGAARITLNRPELRNALSSRMYSEVRLAARVADHDERTDLIVYEGAGSDFSSGGDLKEAVDYIDEFENGNPEAIYTFTESAPFEAVRRTDKVTIAKVHGWCAGGGILIACCCDLVITAHDAMWATPEARVGVSEPFVPAVVGSRCSPTKLNLMMYTGESISGTEAERIGLATMSVPLERLEDSVRDLIDRIRKTTPEARRRYKHLVAQNTTPVAYVGTPVPTDDPEAFRRLRKFAGG
jgi:enoyl-CoA hydratase